ncbi:DEAD/DEAH box helicase [Desulfosoma caldarium]|uniref:Uncharacterized protein DUF1998 n=1 Tax=Desulfosoma caldarium TaxID=610254 RepID=A0A3N1VRN4_9BACT|nr:DEAD/DEAH box helicase [Desulfosoma caldarium]ROR02912.1 uncharacterized protein DUF1998 [Desulfosoma caldarium]
MTANVPQAVRGLISEYRRFLRTSYRFLDDRLRHQFENHLDGTDVIVRGPYVTLARDFERGRTLEKIVAAGGLHPDLLKARWPFGKERLFRHQEDALAALRVGRSCVITTGTGSGKTEAFLLPVLDGILRRKAEGVQGLQAVLLYPMNALANDQLERLRRLLRGTGIDISFALYTGDSDAAAQSLSEAPAETERLTRAHIRREPPDLILTNYKQLEFLLVRRQDRQLFTRSLRYLVLDEIHSYRGALATEIACLIRRLKAHAGLTPGELLAIGTSATVAAKKDGSEALARFATTLFGETVAPQDVIGEHYAPRKPEGASWTPPRPNLNDALLADLNPSDDASVVALAERLTGRSCPPDGPIADRVAAVFDGNRIVHAIEEIFAEPVSITRAAEILCGRLPERADVPAEEVRREIEAYLLVGSVGDDEHPPRLRPKLHTFFHGVYDVALCLNPDCRALVPQGGAECVRCGSVAWPAALCRTCGQDFVKIRFEREDDNRPVGTGDFYSDENTAFLTHEILKLPEGPGTEDEEAEEGAANAISRSRRRKNAEERLIPTGVCLGCGRLLGEGASCPVCNRPAIRMLIHRGKLSTCPACGDIYTRGDIVTPLRTGTASTVSVLATHHLDRLDGADRKLLVFADNRQDAAHQAGYTTDKHRSFALRHAVARAVRDAGDRGVYLSELPQQLFDIYCDLGIIPRRLTRPERDRWLDAITYEAANEFTRYSRQRASLENLGLVAVDYEFLDELEKEGRFQQAAREAGLDVPTALLLARAVLDTMRKNRAVAYDFFQEYIDPVRKRRYRELEAEPYSVRFPERDRWPRAFALDRPDHIRKTGPVMGFVQENSRVGQLTATQKIAMRLIADRDASERFLRELVALLVDEEILVQVSNLPIPRCEQVSGLRPLQIDPRVLRLYAPESGFRCNACQAWRPYELPVCPTPRCARGRLAPSPVDQDNYYVRLYLDRPPQRLAVAEHTAQISGEERARRETAFKEGRLDMLVCTPTLELGVDIGPLLTVVMRNAPPTPANYAQRSGRAGRRLRIGFVSTFCAGGAHDRHAFERPEWLIGGHFEPPHLRLDNPKVVLRHLRSYVLECVGAELPDRLGDLLDDIRKPTRWKKEELTPLFTEVRQQRAELVKRLAAVFDPDRREGRTKRYGNTDAETILDRFEDDLIGVFEGWWQRVRQLDREFREYSQVGSPRQDERKAAARKRAYYEITQDPERAYTLNYLATRGLLPAYQFPLDTFSLDPGVADTPTLYRPSAMALEEFAPGNYVYANGHKLRSIRVLFSGGPGSVAGTPGRTDAETSGRLQAFHFCEQCEEAVEAGKNRCPRCQASLPEATDVVFVDAFEAEENLKISAEEESRQRQNHERRENLLAGSGSRWRIYPYLLTPVELVNLAGVLVTNWGRLEGKTGRGSKFWLCPDCGRHLPHDPSDPERAKQVQDWRTYHRRFCSGEPAPLVLAYQFETDCLILTVPSRGDVQTIGRSSLSPSLVTLAEALLIGAGHLLELEPGELAAFVRKRPQSAVGEQIVFYETVPGGAGYLEEMAARLPAVAQAALERLFGHTCAKACYLCLKRYSNQRWHPFFDKDQIRDLLLILSKQEPVVPQDAQPGTGLEVLENMLAAKQSGADSAVKGYTKGEIEEPLRAALETIAELPLPEREHEVRDEQGRLVTVPDFAWPDVKLAVYCDGFAIHGNPETLELDARKRNFLQTRGWIVLTYWGRTILKDPTACAQQVAAVYRQRSYGPTQHAE